jgi:Ribbon-helix-helix domain
MPRPRTGKIKTSIYLDVEVFDALKQISDRTLIPTSNLIRLGIKKIVAEYNAKLEDLKIPALMMKDIDIRPERKKKKR